MVSKQVSMDAIVTEICKEFRVHRSEIVRRGKLTNSMMEIRQKAIRKIHATGRYRRGDIARFFGLSTYTITSSLEEGAKTRTVPYTPEEDEIVYRMHCEGATVDEIRKDLKNRSVASVRRRIATLTGDGSSIRPFPKPSYNTNSTSSRMIELAKAENAMMRAGL